MPRFARKFLAASLVALHATVMLCGPCLHGLAGWGHGAGLSRPADPDRVRDPVGPKHVLADDCPVCHFLSQAQLPVDAARVVSVRHVLVLEPETSCGSVTPRLLHSTSPRAPPATAAGLA